MNKKAIIEAILQQLIQTRKTAAQCIYFGALTADDSDYETFGDLIDQLIEKERHGN